MDFSKKNKIEDILSGKSPSMTRRRGRAKQMYDDHPSLQPSIARVYSSSG